MFRKPLAEQSEPVLRAVVSICHARGLVCEGYMWNLTCLPLSNHEISCLVVFFFPCFADSLLYSLVYYVCPRQSAKRLKISGDVVFLHSHQLAVPSAACRIFLTVAINNFSYFTRTEHIGFVIPNRGKNCHYNTKKLYTKVKRFIQSIGASQGDAENLTKQH